MEVVSGVARLEVRVADVAGEFAITPDDGEQVYDRIRPELREGRAVLLDFTGVQVVASPFLNMAVGRLFEDDPHGDIIPDRLETRGLSPHDRGLLDRVIANAREYYGNPVARRARDTAIANAVEDL